MSRAGRGGVLWGLIGGLGIGLPPILRFGSEEMKNRVAPGCISGQKRICLAITCVGAVDVSDIAASPRAVRTSLT